MIQVALIQAEHRGDLLLLDVLVIPEHMRVDGRHIAGVRLVQPEVVVEVVLPPLPESPLGGIGGTHSRVESIKVAPVHPEAEAP